MNILHALYIFTYIIYIYIHYIHLHALYNTYMSKLIKACRDNDTELATFIHNKCEKNNLIDLNLKDKNGWTALRYTCFNKNIELARLLIKNGGNFLLNI